MKNAGVTKKIVWAVDPFAKDKSVQSVTALAIQKLVKGIAAWVEPVYAISSASFDLPVKLPRDLERELQASAQEELQEILRKVKLPQIKPIRVLSEAAQSLQQCANSLISYARTQGADLIVLSTRATKGPKRWFIGSFAETVLLSSDVPLLIVNPTEQKAPDFRHILFPTDFSKESRAAFEKVMQFAEAQESSITLFHKVSFDWMLGFGPAFSAYPEYRKIFDEDIEWKKDEAKAWAADALKKGVRVTAAFDHQKGISTSEAILRRSAKHRGIIALVAKSGHFASAVLGSTSRRLVREATTPVWVIYNPTKKKSASRKKR